MRSGCLKVTRAGGASSSAHAQVEVDVPSLREKGALMGAILLLVKLAVYGVIVLGLLVLLVGCPPGFYS